MTKYEYFKNIALEHTRNGWGIYKSRMYKGSIYPKPTIQFDNMWFQGMYGIFLALDYDQHQKNLMPILNFIDGVNKIFEKTEGIYLRDNCDEAIDEYKNGRTNLEASKDQILGLTTALFMIYYYVDDTVVRDKITTIALKIKEDVANNLYLLCNRTEHRFYDSAFYATVHHYGLSKALKYILRQVLPMFWTPLNGILRLIHPSMFTILEWRKKIVKKELTLFGINIINFPPLKDMNWWKDLWSADEFGVNLTFYEMLIGATISRQQALRVMKTLEHPDVMCLKHLNLAALYFYCINKWRMHGTEEQFYLKVMTRENNYYNQIIPPNSKNWGYIHGSGDDTVNGFFHTDYTTEFSEDWFNHLPSTDMDYDDLVNASEEEEIEIDTCIPWLVRKLMNDFKSKEIDCDGIE